MSRARSIPPELYNTVVERWTVGQSPGQIARWLNTSNSRRKLKVHTSRASVARLLKELVNSQSGQCQVAAINRARMRAPELQARMELVDRKLLDCLDWSAELDGTAATRSRFSTRLRTLALMSAHTHRQLKAAGTTGADADRALEKWEGVLTGMRDRIQAEEVAERAARIEGVSEGKTPANPGESDSDTPHPANDDTDALPEVRAAYEAGLAQAPVEVTVLPAVAIESAPQPPLTPSERAYAEGYAVTWGQQVQARAERQPGDDERLLDRSVAEVQLQKRFVAHRELVQAADPVTGHVDEAWMRSTEPLRGTVTLAPEEPIPPEWAGDRAQAEAYRIGLLDLRIPVETIPIDFSNVINPNTIVLTPVERAWCAGRCEAAKRTSPMPENEQARLFEKARRNAIWKASLSEVAAEENRARSDAERLAPASNEVWR